MQENELVTEVLIDAPPAEVWAVLTDFPRYREWNDKIDYLDGSATEGVVTRILAAKGTPAEREFFGKVVEVVEPRLLASEGGDPELFFGQHRWELHPHGAGTRLVNRESFSGPIAADVIAEGRETLTKEFTDFNAALKTAIETRTSHMS